MKLTTVFLLLLMLLFGATPGIGAEKLSPQEVTERFWTAIQTKDIPALRKYIASNSLKEENLAAHLPSVNSVELGRILIDKNQAWIETNVVMGGDEPVTIPLETVLIKENGQWEVLYDETVAISTEASDLARFLERFGDLSAQFERKFNQSLEELQRSIPQVEEELEDIEKKLKAQIPEIKEHLKGLMQELEELFRSVQQAPPSEGEKAI